MRRNSWQALERLLKPGQWLSAMPLRRRSCQLIPPGSQYVEALYDVQGITKSRRLITVSRPRQTRCRQAAPSTPNGWERLPCGLRIKFERPGMVPGPATVARTAGRRAPFPPAAGSTPATSYWPFAVASGLRMPPPVLTPGERRGRPPLLLPAHC